MKSARIVLGAMRASRKRKGVLKLPLRVTDERVQIADAGVAMVTSVVGSPASDS
ncbi:hypothetical protein [Phaffia rhodozyma]|uniref:Uncharacterized protein n=1 Tax=Phaffia rhodozyma TaxID=264483 RepID=A0A0F7SR40_PHARH|nr:hypothetical protein [Phaffia rhodozyma]